MPGAPIVASFLLVAMAGAPIVASLLLVAMPGAPIVASFLLVAMPGAPSSVLAPVRSFLLLMAYLYRFEGLLGCPRATL